MRQHRTIVLLPLLVLASAVAACGDDHDVGAADVEEVQDVGETDTLENADDTTDVGEVGNDGNGDGSRPEGWTEPTHGKDAEPNYAVLFALSKVHRIDIAIAPSDFEAMQADLTELLDGTGLGGGGDIGGGLPPEATTACEGLAADDPCEYTSDAGTTEGTCQSIGSLACLPTGLPGGGGPGGMGGPPPEATTACEGLAANAACEYTTADGNVAGTCMMLGALTCMTDVGGLGGGGAGVSLTSRDPIYVPVELRYEGRPWNHVGMRYKGNSSLAGSIQEGNGKIAFRLDFDEFEDDFPEIDNQRFYGFKKMTFSSNWSDDSLIRDAYVSEVLRDRGVPAARCAFYRVFVDVGNGPEYWGLYTMIEDPADGAMLDAQMGGRGGNLYKPEGTGADWTTFVESGFEKKTNESAADWSDVEAAIGALHADASDAATWRSNLEATFDVDQFLTWLAVNTAIVNWDAYGNIAHNYYLYASPEETKLRWIPWDHNLAMMEQGIGGGGLGGGFPSGGGDAASEIFHTAVGEQWPLISLLLADPVYHATYRAKLESGLGGLFDNEAGSTRMRELHDLIRPYVVGAEGERPGYTHITSEQAFLDAIDGVGGLAEHVSNRHARVMEALGL